jgi:hypothetical protein
MRQDKAAMAQPFRKDESLDRLAEAVNVAQFVSYAPGSEPQQQFCRVAGLERNHVFADLPSAISILMRASAEQSLNVRSFRPDDPKSNEFLYGLTSTADVESAVRRLAGAGLFVIVNETVDVHDGGVSGVMQGGAMEFAPDDTPRCVEKPGTASLPTAVGLAMLANVYGIDLAGADYGSDHRLEFSVHPKPRGWKSTHLLGWELEHLGGEIEPVRASWEWPNNFSRMVGDKAFGLLIANALGLPVPRTTVINRRIAPFSFGQETGSSEIWLRTCPREQVPGRFTTCKGWMDPFLLLAKEDPAGGQIASVLSQRAVPSVFSGAVITSADDHPVIEGRRGEGEILMKGIALPERLPREVVRSVTSLYEAARAALKAPVRFEWVYDGRVPWLVQFHRGATQSLGSVLVPGDASEWVDFDVSLGLEALRAQLSALHAGQGLTILGRVGLTSHIADVVRKARRPARIRAA